MDSFLQAIYLLPLFCVLFLLNKLLLQRRHHNCYVLDYVCYKATDDRKLDADGSADLVLRNKNLGLQEYRFSLKTMARSGLGEETYGPAIVFAGREEFPTLADIYSELDETFFYLLDRLFSKSHLSPQQIDILVVNVSLFASMPSLASRIINRYRMRDDIKAFNLSGMGCSASLNSIGIVQNLFKLRKRAYAVVVSTESLASHWYCGKEASMMLSNILFRSGGCALLLTNNPSLKHRAALRLKRLVLTHQGSSDEAYDCCMEMEDELGYHGFQLTKSLPKVAAQALAENLRILLPKVLRLRELLRYALASYCLRGRFGLSGSKGEGLGLNLKAGIDHFCLHPGGRAVIDGIGKSLGLSEHDLEPSRMALHRFGNTAPSGLWYILSYMEAKKRLKKGDRVFMAGLGAGFMCNTCVWEVVRDMEDVNVWKDCIGSYPHRGSGNPFMEKHGWINDPSLLSIEH
ncbi:3-ketoacyl-CoA synthase 19-like [Malania oleifera]|uniref:3-ketoacyl-CoA synthase 19-like n=1 Tax=Malania oleifera TaxID=397392 RepID=UPI0025AE6814|nr:3-ketoacyl-CoA synthase 19-like [Malania oleifera]